MIGTTIPLDRFVEHLDTHLTLLSIVHSWCT